MPRYLATWEIDIEADTAHDAARQAHEIVRRPDTTATVYNVYEFDGDGDGNVIDLSEDDDVQVDR